MSRLRKALKNEYVRSAVFLAIIVVSIAAFWLGLRAYLRTEYPLLAVASGSMVPTLNEGDLIVVHGGLNSSEIVAEDGTGDIIVFHKPTDYDELIVHRAIDKEQRDDGWYFETKGDANNSPDYWRVPDRYIVGKVVWNIPYLGNVPLFVHTQEGMMIIVILIVILVLLEFIIPYAKERTGQPEGKAESLSTGPL